MKRIIALFCLLLSSALFAQDWQQQVSLHYRNSSLASVLNDLEKQYNLQFSYSPDRLPLEKRIRFRAKRESLRQAVNRLFEENRIAYAELSGLIVLKMKPKAQSMGQINADSHKKAPQRQGVFHYDPYDRLREAPALKQEHKGAAPRQYLSNTVLPSYEPQALLVSNQALEAEPLKPLSRAELEPTKRAPDFQIDWVLTKPDSADFPLKVQVSLLPLLSTRPNNTQSTNHLSFNLFWGLSGGLAGLELGLLGNTLLGDMYGLQVAGLVNTVNGKGIGIQCAGLANSTRGEFLGLQVAGLSNITAGLRGIQVSGLSNITKEAQGIQIAGLGNIASTMQGAQFGGIYNLSNGKMMGLQVAGILNMAWNSQYAAQFAGIANYSSTAQVQAAGILNVADTVQGVQVALINVGKRVQGIQVGLINVVDSLQGVTLGLINIVRKNGYNHLEVGSNEILPLTGMFKMGGQFFYQNFIFGHRINDNIIGLGWGIGSRLPISPKAGLNIEANAISLIDDWNWTRNELNTWGSFRITGEWVIAKRFRFFAGPSLNVFVANQIRQETGAYGNSDLVPYHFINEMSADVNAKIWVGGSAGVRF